MLSQELLKGLNAHKYSCSGRSITEPLFQIFWNWLVLLMPRWLAPNLITFIGLLCNVAGSGALLYYTPKMTETAPWWSYVAVAVTLFVYQSLDAIDGKQARRTNSSSPLGELFDHGCDALSGALLLLTTMSVLRIGDDTVALFGSMLIGLAVFYSAHWRAYTGGTLEFGLLDVTEAQLSMMAMQLVAAYYGPEVLATPLLGYPISYLVLLAINSMAVFVLVNNCAQAFLKRNAGHCKPGGWVTPAIPYAVLLACTGGVLLLSPGNIGASDPLLLGLLVGCVSAQLASRLVVAHMSKTPMDVFDLSVAPLLAVLLNIVAGAPLPEHLVVVYATVAAALNLVLTSSIMCQEISQHMGIYVFTIGKRAD